jgi:hypothetical protein
MSIVWTKIVPSISEAGSLRLQAERGVSTFAWSNYNEMFARGTVLLSEDESRAPEKTEVIFNQRVENIHIN